MSKRAKVGHGLPPRITPPPPATFANISHGFVGAASNRRTPKLRQLCNRPLQKLDKEFYDNYHRIFGERPRGNFKLVIETESSRAKRDAKKSFKSNYDAIFGRK